MTQDNASTLLKKFSEPYLRPYSKELPEWDAMRWVKLFMGLSISYEQAGGILTQFLSFNPPSYKEDGTAFGTMPNINHVEHFLEIKAGTVKNYCSKCDKTGWIFVPARNGVIRCECASKVIDMGDYVYEVGKKS